MLLILCGRSCSMLLILCGRSCSMLLILCGRSCSMLLILCVFSDSEYDKNCVDLSIAVISVLALCLLDLCVSASEPHQAGCEEGQAPLCLQLLPPPWVHLELRCFAPDLGGPQPRGQRHQLQWRQRPRGCLRDRVQGGQEG